MNFKEHLLVLLTEEAAEVAKETAMALRFGLWDRNVLNPGAPTNQERMIDELNDLMGVVAMLEEHEILPVDWRSAEKQKAKREKVMQFMLYAQSVGALHAPVSHE